MKIEVNINKIGYTDFQDDRLGTRKQEDLGTAWKTKVSSVYDSGTADRHDKLFVIIVRTEGDEFVHLCRITARQGLGILRNCSAVIEVRLPTCE